MDPSRVVRRPKEQRGMKLGKVLAENIAAVGRGSHIADLVEVLLGPVEQAMADVSRYLDL